MIGVSPTVEYVRKYRDDAIATPGLSGEFETKMCNRWLHSAATWLNIPAWDNCADPALTLDQFAGDKCYIGIDAAERDDITALAVVIPRGELLYCFVTGFLPQDVVVERARTVPMYLEWAKSGDLVLTSGNFTDYAQLETVIRDLCGKFDVAQIVIERYGALRMASNLTEDGLPAAIQFKNAKVFTGPCQEFEARIRAGKVRHTGSSFLKWQISNVCVERRRDGSLLPTKDRAESPNTIDAVDALLLALSAAE
jgi:phage terminase large subunit-like protein